MGGSGFFDPTGQRKANDWFRSTISSITKTLDTIVSENSAKSGVSKTAAKKASANQARYQLIQSILGGGNQTFIKNLKYHAARVLTTYDAENALQIWVANTKVYKAVCTAVLQRTSSVDESTYSPNLRPQLLDCSKAQCQASKDTGFVTYLSNGPRSPPRFY